MRRVKHLNPRQGITIAHSIDGKTKTRALVCETPKSPPGDYNMVAITVSFLSAYRLRVKHLNPRQGITIRAVRSEPRREPYREV